MQRRVGVERQPELEFLFRALAQSDEINFGPRHGEIVAGSLDVFGADKLLFQVTPKGWAALEAANAIGLPGNCFVAMSFRKDQDETYRTGIQAAVEDDCGLTARRVDRIEHVGSINDRILAELRRAQCAVADFTGQRAGVYFEAGFMLGLGRPVVWTCRTDDLENLHFDTKHYNSLIGPILPICDSVSLADFGRWG